MQALTLLQKFFSVDMVIYAAIVLVAATALARCTMPLSRVVARLRRAARTIVTESKPVSYTHLTLPTKLEV